MPNNQRQTQFGRIFPPREDWLQSRSPETIIDPELPIIDTHHHLWDRENHLYLLPEFLADAEADSADRHNVVATVYMECGSMYRAGGPGALRPVGEVEFAAGIAAMCESGRYGPARVAAGIVGFADLCLGDGVAEVLEGLEAVGGGRLRGIRHAAGWDDDPAIGNSHHGAGPGLYSRDDFRAGLDCLTAHGLSLDAWLYHPQLGDLVDLARACPDANIIMNHTGGMLGYGVYKGRTDENFALLKAGLTELASCPNVTMKLGGMMMRLASVDYLNLAAPPTSEDLAALWRPNIETCIELFGADRCMFESNFPVDKMGIGYRALWNTFKRITAGASDTERETLFAGTARRAYRLD
ncbi:MAG: amidohydrolase family protein [Alphaproteobacteria bacterium]|jgi:predicted TIM-barrel fold metal-dependent hydrolase|nr:amidohydrolase family protein [Alphaproteobacteria bacterium]